MDLPDCGCLLCDNPIKESAWDARDRRIAANVGEHGWNVNGVAGGRLPGDWSYSIGLWHTLRSPEASVFGIPAQTGMRIINVLGARIRDGQALQPDQRRDDVLNGLPVVIRHVHPSWYSDFFGAALDFYQRPPLPITQMFWPDKQVPYVHSQPHRRQDNVVPSEHGPNDETSQYARTAHEAFVVSASLRDPLSCSSPAGPVPLEKSSPQVTRRICTR